MTDYVTYSRTTYAEGTMAVVTINTTDGQIAVPAILKDGGWIGAFWTGHDWAQASVVPVTIVPLKDIARAMTPENPHATVYDWLAQGWGQDEMVKHGFAVSTLEEGEIAPGVRGFEVTVPAGSALPPRSVDVSPLGDPNDPSTWRADLPVDHPNYCKPFGVDRE